jgi:membrane dipeptidase
MRPQLIIDAHEDIAYNAFALQRDIHASTIETRAREGQSPRGGIATLGLPELIRGNVRVIFATIYVAPPSTLHTLPGRHYSSAEEAEEQAREQLAFYGLLAADPRIQLITNQSELERVVKSPTPRLGIVLLMEGADPIVRPQDAARWFADGVRIIGTSWGATRYAGGTGAPGPLTEAGRALMREMSRSGFILDTSHMSEESFFEALDLFDGTVIASHSNVRAFVESDRHLSDDMIRKLIERDGVIGTVLYNTFLKQGWRESKRKADVTLNTVIAHIKHICDFAGDTRHVGIGSDFDGGFGAESTPHEIDTVADLQKFSDALARAGFSDADIVNYLSGNWLRVLRRALPSGDGSN